MPKPTPDYIPGEIRDQIAALGYSGVTEYSEHIGLNRVRLLSVFAGPSSTLRLYKALADALGVSMDQLKSLILTGQLAEAIAALAKRRGVSLNQLSMQIGASHTFLARRLKSGCNPNGLQSYIEVAEALGWSLQKLTETCLR